MKSKFKKAHLLITAGVASMALILAVLATVFISYAQTSLYDESASYMSEVSKKGAELIRSKVSSEIDHLECVAEFIGNESEFDFDEFLAVLSRESRRSGYKRMGIVMPDGRATTTDGYTFDFSKRDYFKLAMQGRGNVSDRLIDVVDSKPIHVCAVPVYYDGSIVAAIFATQMTEVYSNLIGVNTFGNQGFSYIVTNKGEKVTHADHGNCKGEYDNFLTEIFDKGSTPEQSQAIRMNMRDGKNGLAHYSQDGEPLILSYTKIGVNDWYLMSAVPEVIITRNSNRLVGLLATIASVIIIAIVIIGFCALAYINKSKLQVEKIAFTDRVTGFGNWNFFGAQARKLLDAHKHIQYVIVIFDIDQFKMVNDVFGHEKGNEILCDIAKVLDANLDRELETFARTSSDNFNVLMRYESNDSSAERVMSLIRQFGEYVSQYSITFSFGLYVIADEKLDISTLSDRANIAKRTVKGDTTQFYAFYSDSIRNDLLRDKEIESMMEDALATCEFQIYLQPKYWFKTGKLAGAEALVRWQSAQKGMLYPDSFIPLFERNGFIKHLDMYMFDHACEIVKRWQQSGMAVYPISVNLSRLHLNNKELPSTLKAITQKHGILPGCIEIELTESAVFNDKMELIKIMSEIKHAGFLISIDDFGSGYSSLNTLKDLPADTLKIDKEFLTEATDSDRGKKIIRSILRMTQDLHLKSVAEGVETSDQNEFLKEAGCDIAQGYYYAKPMTVDDFEKLM